MGIDFKPAVREQLKARVCIDGPSGSGKTYGAIQMALGMASSPDKVFVIDTEEGSALCYDKLGQFMHIKLQKPYTAAKYLAYIEAAEKAGAECIVIDSITHLWSGSGGLLDKHDRITATMKNSYAAWRDVTPDHNNFVNAMLTSSCHVIATVRSKQAYEIVENERGKKAPKKMGLAPEFKAGIEYEFMVCLSVDREKHYATASKDRTDTFDDGPFIIGRETGILLRDWLSGGVAPEPEPVPEPVKAAAPPPAASSEEPKGSDNPNKKFIIRIREIAGKTADILQCELGDGDIKAFGFARYGKESRKDWTKDEFTECAGWLNQMQKDEKFILPKEYSHV